MGNYTTPVPGAAAPKTEKEKPYLYYNQMLPRADGTGIDFGSIWLYKNNPDHAAIIAAFESGQLDDATMRASIVGTFRLANNGVPKAAPLFVKPVLTSVE